MERLTERIKRPQKDDLIVYTNGKHDRFLRRLSSFLFCLSYHTLFRSTTKKLAPRREVWYIENRIALKGGFFHEAAQNPQSAPHCRHAGLPLRAGLGRRRAVLCRRQRYHPPDADRLPDLFRRHALRALSGLRQPAVRRHAVV